MPMLVHCSRLKAVTQVPVWAGGGSGVVVTVAGGSAGSGSPGLGCSSAVLAEPGQLLLPLSPGPAGLVIITPTVLLKHAK